MNSHLWTEVFWASVIAGGLVAGMPLMLAALGETISERAGVLNIGLEGMMLVGATRRLPRRFLSSLLVAGVARRSAAPACGPSIIVAVFCVRLGLDQIVVGIAVLITAEGVTSVLQRAPSSGATYPAWTPWAREIPCSQRSRFWDRACSASLSSSTWAWRWWCFALGAAILDGGLDLRAAGEKPQALDSAGVSVIRTRSSPCS